ncbi:MAG: anti-sigma factor [Bryobacterales bacterium]
MNDDRIQGLCLEYALGTLEGEDLAELEQLLADGDEDAQAALAEAYETVAAIGLSAEDAAPSPDVRSALLARAGERARVVEMPARPASRGRPAFAWAAAAAGLVCAALLWQQLRTTRDALRSLQARFDDFAGRQEDVAAQNERYRRILDILAAPDTFSVELNAADNARIQAYWNDRQGLVVAGRNIPQPSPGRELQLWVVPRSGAPESVEVFRPDEDGNALILAQPRTTVAEADALAITDEPEGGSAAPTTTPIWAGRP